MYDLFLKILKYKSFFENSVDFCYFTQPFCHKKFGFMLICRNAEGVHGQRKVGNPCSILFRIRVFSLLCPMMLLCSFLIILILENDRYALQLVIVRDKEMRKSFSTFASNTPSTPRNG